MGVAGVEEAAEILVRAKQAVAFTGAGISADSGIPTFRGPNGLWKKFRPEELATPEAFRRDPAKVWRWYAWRMRVVFSARPSPGHIALARLERLGVIRCVITQNVDGLHQEAGSRCVVELHGSIRRVRCARCGYRRVLTAPPSDIPPRCPRCGGLLRPDVVWFGEPLPRDAWERAAELVEEADAMLVVGTSGSVMPAASLPFIARGRGAAIVEVNVEPSTITPIATVFLRGRASEVLPAIASAVEELLGARG